MTHLFRISTPQHINDLSGTGAKIFGGRWNDPGFAVVYTSSSRSLAALEFLVHVPMALAPSNLSIAEIIIPQNIRREVVEITKLPQNWHDYPAPEKLAELGSKWLLSNSSLLLDVPSAVVDQEFNTLINPIHPDAKFLEISKVEKFTFNSRLLRNIENQD